MFKPPAHKPAFNKTGTAPKLHFLAYTKVLSLLWCAIKNDHFTNWWESYYSFHGAASCGDIKELFWSSIAWVNLLPQHQPYSERKKTSHFGLKSWVTGGTKIRPGMTSYWRIFESNWLDIESQIVNRFDVESQFDSNILQLLGIPGRILVPPVTQLFRAKWLHFFSADTHNFHHRRQWHAQILNCRTCLEEH